MSEERIFTQEYPTEEHFATYKEEKPLISDVCSLKDSQCDELPNHKKGKFIQL